jgi:hypothetical protein
VPYITELRHGPGKPSIIPADIHIHHNFFMGNYNAICAIDTDDGSAYIKVRDNVLAYAVAGLKSDFGGHDEVYDSNLLAYVGECIIHGMDATGGNSHGFNDGFFNNTCVYRNSYTSDCFIPKTKTEWSGGGWQVHDNHVYSASGSTMVCGNTIALADWVAKGHDKGSTTAKWPADEQLIAWGRGLLDITN